MPAATGDRNARGEICTAGSSRPANSREFTVAGPGGYVANHRREAPLISASSVRSVVQQSVPHGPDHDLLLGTHAEFALYGVERVPDGNGLDSTFLRNGPV